MLTGAAFDGCDDERGLSFDGAVPGSAAQGLALASDGFAFAGQDVQDLFAGGGHDLDGEGDAEEPGDVVDGGHEFAAARGFAVERGWAAESLEGSGVGECGVDRAVDAEIAGGVSVAEAADGDDDVGFVEGSADEDGLAGVVGGQIGEAFAVVGVVDDSGDALAEGDGEEATGIANAGIAVGLGLEDGDAVGIDAGGDEDADGGGGNLNGLWQSAVEGDDDAVAGSHALGQGGIVEGIFECLGSRGGEIGQRLTTGQGEFGRGGVVGRIEFDGQVVPVAQKGHAAH